MSFTPIPYATWGELPDTINGEMEYKFDDLQGASAAVVAQLKQAKEVLVYSWVTISGDKRLRTNARGYYQIGVKSDSGYEESVYLNFAMSKKEGDLTMNSVNGWLPKPASNSFSIKLYGDDRDTKLPVARVKSTRHDKDGRCHVKESPIFSEILVVGYRL